MIRRLVFAALLASTFIIGPAQAQLRPHVAFGSGTDGPGNRLSIAAAEDFLLGGTGLAFVRLAGDPSPALPVVLTCVVFDTRPGVGFHFVYTSGTGLDGRDYYIGVFDDHGPGRTGPYDAIYTQTTPVNGPCNVSAFSSYPIGWFPVSSGDYVVS